MAVFPETPLPIYPVDFEPEWKTLPTEFDNGREQRRQAWTFPKYNVNLQYYALKASDVQALWTFYMNSKGALSEFWFFDPAPAIGIVTTHQGLYVGTGDGVTDIFDLPGKNTSSRILYFDGVEQGSGFSYLSGTGDGGADQVTFAGEDIRVTRTGDARVTRSGDTRTLRGSAGGGVAPAEGTLITCDFTGQLRIRCRFALDKLNRQLFQTVLFNLGIQLKGLGPA